MILGWSYFLILQAIVLSIFIWKQDIKDNYPLNIILPTRIHFLIFNTCIFSACYFYNEERQLFCNPVAWAAIGTVLFCISFLAIPFYLNRTKFLNFLILTGGLGFFIGIYVILFARFEHLMLVIIFLPIFYILDKLLRFLKKKLGTNILDAFYFYPAIILAPFLILFQLWTLFKSLSYKKQRYIFLVTPILALLISLILTFQINSILKKIDKAVNKEREIKTIIANPVNYYLTELILGAHWKYHTELCLYDGWRPPFHDPILVIANKILFPFAMFGQYTELYPVMPLYKSTFPENTTTFKCKCAANEHLFDLN